LGTAVLVLVGAALAVKLAGPVVAAMGELVHVLVIVAVIVGVGAITATAYARCAWRSRRAAKTATRRRRHLRDVVGHPALMVRAVRGLRRPLIIRHHTSVSGPGPGADTEAAAPARRTSIV